LLKFELGVPVMQFSRSVLFCLLASALPLTGCTTASVKPLAYADAAPSARVVSPSDMDGLISKYAQAYDMPESLLRRVIVRESGYNPKARNGPYWGLMQIRHDTATVMGYKGPASGLLDAETNLKYAGRYLRGAYLVADRNPDRAVRLYASGYYYDAKRKGMLEEAGFR